MSCTTAARGLAQVLIDQAEALASDDLDVISAAMSTVRAAARKLEGSLTRRGWGGDVLYGWATALPISSTTGKRRTMSRIPPRTMTRRSRRRRCA